MQSIFEPTPPPPLPTTTGLAHYTLESPWALALVLVVAAGLCWMFVVPMSRGRAGRIGAAVLALLGIGVVVLANLVDTPREKVQHAVVGLVDAIATGDTRRADALLTPAAAIYDFEGSSPIDKASILERVSTDFGHGGKYELADRAVLEAQIAVDSAASAKTQIKVRVSSKDWGGPYISWWRMDLSRDGDGPWRVSGIQPISLPGHGGL